MPDLHLAALNFGHIQYIVYQSQQVAGGCRNLFQTCIYLGIVTNILPGNRIHADNPIHGRPDLVAHAAEEFTFCTVCSFRRGFCLPQGTLIPPHVKIIKEKYRRNNSQDHQQHGNRISVQPVGQEADRGVYHIIWNRCQHIPVCFLNRSIVYKTDLPAYSER